MCAEPKFVVRRSIEEYYLRSMALPVTLRFVPLALALSACAVGNARAQLPDVPERCTRQASQQSAQVDDTPYRKAIVDRIDFDEPIHLSDADIRQVIDNLNQAEVRADSPGWIDELREVGLHEVWQDGGYFEAKANVTARSVDANASEEHFVVTAHVDEGLQYHLGDIRFEGDSTVPETEVREAIPLREGELFSVSKVREGIQSLTKLFGSHGYIDFTVVPRTEVDQNLQRISLVMHLDTQKQFRVGKIDVVGLDPTLEAQVRSIVRPGEIFNPATLDEFFKDRKAVLLSGLYPTDAYISPYTAKRNVRTGIVDLTFDFRSCPDASQSRAGALTE